MEHVETLPYIADILKSWYQTHKRDLPWRETSDPYNIWISEVILQQTRVNQGMDYYLRFIERFPTVTELANAHEDEVLKYWQGLGYYSRARNLHKAAQQIVAQFGGHFPTQHSDILSLSGIGDYTAAAICSLAYNQAYAVVDGNVYRVLSRLFAIETPIDTGIGKKQFSALAQALLSRSEPATHNQAMMEFGALQCIPTSPNCEICPLQALCSAFKLYQVSNFPVKSQKLPSTNRYFNYLFINYKHYTFLQKRTAKDIWQNLYEFPLIESDKLYDVSALIENEYFQHLFEGVDKVNIRNTTNPIKHILSHRVIHAQCTTVSVSKLSKGLQQFVKVPLNGMGNFAVSRLMELFLEKM